MSRLVARALLSLMVFCASSPVWAGKLSEARDSVRAEESEPEDDDHKHRKHKKRRECDDSGSSELLAEFFGPALVYSFFAPIWLPSSIIEGEPFTNEVDFTDFPYADGVPASMTSDGGAKGWRLRLMVEDAHDLDDINRIGGGLLAESHTRLGVATRWSHLQENLGPGGHDSFVLGNVDATWRFAQNERVQMRVGAGLRVFSDDVDSEYGINLSYGGDFLLVEPIVLSSTIDYSHVGSANLFESRTTLGVMVNRVEIFTGYDFLRIGTTNIHGLIGGVRLWF